MSHSDDSMNRSASSPHNNTVTLTARKTATMFPEIKQLSNSCMLIFTQWNEFKSAAAVKCNSLQRVQWSGFQWFMPVFLQSWTKCRIQTLTLTTVATGTTSETGSLLWVINHRSQWEHLAELHYFFRVLMSLTGAIMKSNNFPDSYLSLVTQPNTQTTSEMGSRWDVYFVWNGFRK